MTRLSASGALRCRASLATAAVAVLLEFVLVLPAEAQNSPSVLLPFTAAPTCPPDHLRDYSPTWGTSVWQIYSSRMQRMGEPVLACGAASDDETYRFTF